MTRIIFISLLLIGATAHADDLTTNGGMLTFRDPGPASLRIQMGTPEAYVTIKPDGTIEYGKNYTPDAAAKQLWDAIGVERAARNCK